MPQPNILSPMSIPNNLSSAPIAPPLVPQVQTGTIQSSFNPSLSLNSQAFVQGSTNPILSFPADVPKYNFTIQLYEYHRDSLSTVGQITPAVGFPSIVLPLPQQLLEPTQVAWEEVPLNNLSQEVGGIFGGAIGAFLGGLGGSIGGAATGGSIGASVGNFGLRYAEARCGYMANEFTTILMRGPVFRRFNFTWELSPNNVEEAENLRDIITVIKNAMSPQLALGGLLWKFPLIFRIRLYPNCSYLFKTKPAICNNFFVDYTGGAGRAAFHANKRQIDGENPPALVTLHASFIEIELWQRGQFNTSNDPNAVESVESGAAAIEQQPPDPNAAATFNPMNPLNLPLNQLLGDVGPNPQGVTP
jgi:hypothetical protein